MSHDCFLEKLSGVPERCLGVLVPGEHPGQLSFSLLAFDDEDLCTGASWLGLSHIPCRRLCGAGTGFRIGHRLLAHHEVSVGPSRHLRQVGDDNDLVVARQTGQPPADLPGGPASDPGVDLVEDEGAGVGRGAC